MHVVDILYVLYHLLCRNIQLVCPFIGTIIPYPRQFQALCYIMLYVINLLGDTNQPHGFLFPLFPHCLLLCLLLEGGVSRAVQGSQ